MCCRAASWACAAFLLQVLRTLTRLQIILLSRMSSPQKLMGPLKGIYFQKAQANCRTCKADRVGRKENREWWRVKTILSWGTRDFYHWITHWRQHWLSGRATEQQMWKQALHYRLEGSQFTSSLKVKLSQNNLGWTRSEVNLDSCQLSLLSNALLDIFQFYWVFFHRRVAYLPTIN